MIRAGFLSPVDRADLIALARDGSVERRLARRANALVLLDAGRNFQKVAGALLLDDGTIRAWHKLFVDDGLECLTRFEAGGSACQMSDAQQDKLKAWVAAALPRSTRQIGAWIEKEFGLYPAYFRTRNSEGLMMRKLSVTLSRRLLQFRGTSLVRKFMVFALKWRNVAWHLLWVTLRCMTPHSRSIGLRWGLYGGMKCSVILAPSRASHSCTRRA